MSQKKSFKFDFSLHNVDDSSLRISIAYSISLFLIFAILKAKLYLRFKSYTFSKGVLYDALSILFYDFIFAMLFLLIFYLLKKLFGRLGSFLVEGVYICLIVFSTLSTVTYLRLGAPINAGMIGDIKYDFLKSSIEQQTDLKLLLGKLLLIITIGLVLPYVLKRILNGLFPRYAILAMSGLLILSL
jgi:hypothetical protein